MMRDEYTAEDFAQGVRGKHADRYATRGVKVFLDPEVAAVFADDAAVNEALRTLMRLRSSTAGGGGPDLKTGA